MQCCFFTDYVEPRLRPLTLTRPVDDLRLGIQTLGEKWRHALYADRWFRLVRDELQPLFSADVPQGDVCWINSRFLPSGTLVEAVKALEKGVCIRQGDDIIAARTGADKTRKWIKKGKPDSSSMSVIEAGDCRAVSHVWDLFLMNEQEIINDLKRMERPSSNHYSLAPTAILENEDQIYIGKNATIEAGVMLLAGQGPVFIGEDATVMAGAILRGSVAVCRGATVKMDAKIYHATTVGPVCKVGGEVSNSIFHSYSNKGHDGFVGNSLIGQWCNIGADTNTSNLKNNYGTVRLTDWQSRKERETGQQFLGTVMGDHTKTAINTQLNTGTVCGVSCNIFSADFPPRFMPSFSWVGANVIQPYQIDKALETMQAMMARRDVGLSDDYKELMHRIFEREHG